MSGHVASILCRTHTTLAARKAGQSASAQSTSSV
eukprot:COSAG06_NODE_59647_length_273_cov_1.080460_1_plen_33_part_01